jgi:hypothetical protein
VSNAKVRKVYRPRKGKSELTGKYCEDQSLLECRENVERRKKAISVDALLYNGVNYCEHGSSQRYVKSNRIRCSECYQGWYRKKRTAKGKVLNCDLPTHPKQLAINSDEKYYMSTTPCVNGNYYWRITKTSSCNCACCELQHHPRKHWHPYDYHVIIRNQHNRVMRGMKVGSDHQSNKPKMYKPKNTMALINSVWI